MTRKLSLSYSTLSLARVLSYAMPLNTLPRLSQIYDNSRLFSSVQAGLSKIKSAVSKTAVLFLYCTSVSRYSLFMELLR